MSERKIPEFKIGDRVRRTADHIETQVAAYGANPLALEGTGEVVGMTWLPKTGTGIPSVVWAGLDHLPVYTNPLCLELVPEDESC